MRPRWREYLPLATQQLRLRNLIRIHGQNIECDSSDNNIDALIYYTLHYGILDEPFYISELLPLRHKNLKWAEIRCTEIQLSNANCVCVKVWKKLNEHVRKEEQTETEFEPEPEIIEQTILREKEPMSVLTKELSNVSLSPQNLLRPPDKLLFSWGVFFSGLILLGQYADIKFRQNSLIFQINGDFFTSPEYFTEESLQKQISLHKQRYSTSVPKYIVCQPEESEDSLQNGGHSLTTTNVEKQEDLVRNSKRRYVQWYCNAKDVRKSYDLEMLLRIQRIQRRKLQLQREKDTFAQDIQSLSLHCITEEQLKCKPRTKSLNSSSLHSQHNRSYHSMGRTLSILLAEQEEVNPRTLYHAKQLMKQIETVRCRQRILQNEYNSYVQRIAILQQQLKSLCDEKEQFIIRFDERQLKLEQEKEEFQERLQEIMQLRKTKRQIMYSVERRMCSLCLELREIYPIGQNDNGFYTICNIPFPKLDTFVINNIRYTNSLNLQNFSPITLSVALGYIAHLVQMISVITNRPLRNPIIYEGSKTRIMDMVKDIRFNSREFPLYTRSSLPPKIVKYAICLLNQNISQICYDITGQRVDMRETIKNILRIFETLANIEQSMRDQSRSGTATHPSNRLSLLANHRDSDMRLDIEVTDFEAYNTTGDSIDCIANSESSMDMQNDEQHLLLPEGIDSNTSALNTSPFLQMPVNFYSEPIAIAGRSTTSMRVCRSVGSYSDTEDNLKDIVENLHSNSDSNILFQSDKI